ncbi:hypothetical protein Tdes44962_MAKER09504 [Teratosphaeria destructans]|uniref:Uncharacterized protein n=1 Tax=Teratosphaeria destructans TaxID=418781 RepID=A0A9W7W2L9_9PEZI|nr:hypothetical protein Tdes44962_MAKER09504 [Teratosphaeria destructans]
MAPFTDEEIDQAIDELVFLPRTHKNHPMAQLDKAVEEYLPVKLAAMEKKKAEEAKKAEEKEEAEKQQKEKKEEEAERQQKEKKKGEEKKEAEEEGVGAGERGNECAEGAHM